MKMIWLIFMMLVPWVDANCLAGQGYSRKSRGCFNCPIGRYNDENGWTTGCKACPYGKYNDAEGGLVCKDCAIGKYNDLLTQTSSSACKNCLVGKFQNDVGAADCKDCNRDKFQDEEGQTACKSCLDSSQLSIPDGTACFDYGCDLGDILSGGVCTPCAEGNYQDQFHKDSCKICENGKTSVSGAAKCDIDCGEPNNFAWSKIGTDIVGQSLGDKFGYSVSLNTDGTVMAIGAPDHDVPAFHAGHVRVYQRNQNEWVQMGADILGSDLDDDHKYIHSGKAVSLNGDGTILAVGIPEGDIPADDISPSKVKAGHVRVYQWNGHNAWEQMGNNTRGANTQDQLGTSVSLSSDGLVVAVGAPKYDSSTGAVYVYKWNGVDDWVQLGNTIDGTSSLSSHGFSVSLSSDGGTVVAGAYNADGEAYENSGQARVYRLSNDGQTKVWTQIGNNIDGARIDDRKGYSVSINGDGSIVAVGAMYNDGAGDNAGHVRVYAYHDKNYWVQLGSDIDGYAAGDASGSSVSLSSDGFTLAVGAPHNDNGDVSNAGHVVAYRFSGAEWEKVGETINGKESGSRFGESVSLSSDGSILAIGGIGGAGYVQVYAFGCDGCPSGTSAVNNADGVTVQCEIPCDIQCGQNGVKNEADCSCTCINGFSGNTCTCINGFSGNTCTDCDGFKLDNENCQSEIDFIKENQADVIEALANCRACADSDGDCSQCSDENSAYLSRLNKCVGKSELLQSLYSKHCDTA